MERVNSQEVKEDKNEKKPDQDGLTSQVINLRLTDASGHLVDEQGS